MRALFAVVALATALTAGAYSVAPHEPKPAPAIAVAKIMTKTGHGSGTNIGGGFLTTAAHVVGKEDEVTVRLSDGREVKGEVLWANTRYDLALVRVAETPNFASANLACRSPVKGESVELAGNPLNMEFISTWGRVAGAPLEIQSQWKSVVPVNGAVAGGMSGGAMFDDDGNLIGVIVGVSVMKVGPLSGGPVALGYVIGGDVVCKLMARA